MDKQENIYIVTAKDNMLYAVRPEGSLNWKAHIDGDVAMQPSITAEGSIYVAVQDKSLYVLNPDGKFHWRRRIFSKPLEKPTPATSIGNDVALDYTPETITKPVAESRRQPIPEALRISQKKTGDRRNCAATTPRISHHGLYLIDSKGICAVAGRVFRRLHRRGHRQILGLRGTERW